MSDKLKPSNCPFCNGDYHSNWADECGVTYILHHKDSCILSGEVRSINMPWGVDKLEAWNTRANDTINQTVMDTLQKIHHELLYDRPINAQEFVEELILMLERESL